MANERPAISVAIRRAVLFEPRHHCAVCCDPSEREIDDLVYALYGLAPEEKAIVQSAGR
jgi:hypothetical protein